LVPRSGKQLVGVDTQLDEINVLSEIFVRVQEAAVSPGKSLVLPAPDQDGNRFAPPCQLDCLTAFSLAHEPREIASCFRN
jgi:hypothetical protein